MKTLRDADIEVSLFIDPDLDQVKAADRVEAHAVELHTGRYCDARLAGDRRRELARLVDAAKAAAKLGLQVAAGHGLNYQNVLPVAAIRGDRGAQHRPRHRGPRGAGRAWSGRCAR